MILVDSSLWTDHLRNRNEQLTGLLNNNRVATHDMIIGELACGSIKNRNTFLTYLSDLPRVKNVTHHEIMFFINHHRLYGQGLSYINMNLLAACLINRVELLTLDKKLNRIDKHFSK